MAATSAGAVVVPIYQTNSPEECLWVISDSDAVRDRVRGRRAAREDRSDPRPAPEPAHGHHDRSASRRGLDERRPASARRCDAISLEELRDARARAPLARGARGAPRRGAGREDPYTFIYTSGTTGPPKGCVLTPRQLPRDHRHGRAARPARSTPDDVVYLYLPLAHSYALLVQLAVFDLGGTLAYFGGRHQADRRRAGGGQADLPAVGAAHLREDLHARPRRDRGPAAEERERAQACVELGMQVRDLISRRRADPRGAAGAVRGGRGEAVQERARRSSAGACATAVSGAAPIAREILEFFWACGVPVLEGYGMTETATAATVSTVENHRFGTRRPPCPGVELQDRRGRRDPDQRPEHLPGLPQPAPKRASARSRTAGCTPATSGSIDEDGYLSITGRKKDIIITAGGKNLTPANIENDLKQCRWISQAVMHGDQRPYPVVLITLDEEEIAAYAASTACPRTSPRSRASPRCGRWSSRRSTAPTPNTPRSSRSRSSRSSTTTSPRRRAS